MSLLKNRLYGLVILCTLAGSWGYTFYLKSQLDLLSQEHPEDFLETKKIVDCSTMGPEQRLDCQLYQMKTLTISIFTTELIDRYAETQLTAKWPRSPKEVEDLNRLRHAAKFSSFVMSSEAERLAKEARISLEGVKILKYPWR